MNGYSEYVGSLRRLVDLVATTDGVAPELVPQVEAALDGEAGSELQRLVPLAERRRSGAFFTGSELASRALDGFLENLSEDSVVLDPACGGGDLLLPILERLHSMGLIAGLSSGRQQNLVGRDIHSEFIEVARLRLRLKGYSLTGEASILEFPELQVGDGTKDEEAIRRATHVVLNPPFGQVQAPENCSWASGLVSHAAIFVDELCKAASVGTEILAILPDALRSGSRYESWRRRIGEIASPQSVKPLGQFGASADVDVFALHLTIPKEASRGTRFNWSQVPEFAAYAKLKSYFNVSVGAVVDYREPHCGPSHPFIKARGLAPWKTVSSPEERRKFSGTVFAPPFVVVRRTSRYGDKHRAVGTLVRGPNPVAVENHLVVMAPLDGSEKWCRELMTSLRDERTTEWLNNRIRCRHLTVKALAELPLWNIPAR